jgi:hypothetical protein
MEAHRRVKFTGVEFAAPVEKDAASPMEKATTGPRALEGRDMQEAWWRGRKTGCYTGTVEILAGGAEARWSVRSPRSHGRAAERGRRGGTGVGRRFMR